MLINDDFNSGISAIKQLSSVGKIKDKRIICIDSNYSPIQEKDDSKNVLLIRPLTPSVDQGTLVELFNEDEGLEFVHIMKDQQKSLGYGFLKFKSNQFAEKAKQKLNGSLLRKTKILLDFTNSPFI